MNMKTEEKKLTTIIKYYYSFNKIVKLLEHFKHTKKKLYLC